MLLWVPGPALLTAIMMMIIIMMMRDGHESRSRSHGARAVRPGNLLRLSRRLAVRTATPAGPGLARTGPGDSMNYTVSKSVHPTRRDQIQ